MINDESFWDWFESLDLYTRELVVYDIVKKQNEMGRDLTDEELNEIRAKYDKGGQENGTDEGSETDGQEEAAGGLPERAETDTRTD